MRLVLRHGDCVEVLRQGYTEGSVGAVICDPPYGLEFMGKDWDRLDWTDGGGMASVGLGGRAIPWPSYSGTGAAGTANATCARCGGRMRGANKCSCPSHGGAPDWRVRGAALNTSANADRMRKQQESHRLWLTEAFRVLRPGGVIKAFGGTRTFHRLAVAMFEVGFTDVGLEAWSYGSGFPKSLNVSRSIESVKAGSGGRYSGNDSALATTDETASTPGRMWDEAARRTSEGWSGKQVAIQSEAAKAWEGWGTALKPAWEPVVTGRKPA